MGCFITGSVPFVSHVFSDTQSCNVSLEENLGIQLMVLNYVLGQKLLKNREENLGEKIKYTVRASYLRKKKR